MAEEKFKPGPFYLGKARRPVYFIALLWICCTCSAFMFPTRYPIKWDNFNSALVALGVSSTLIMLCVDYRCKEMVHGTLFLHMYWDAKIVLQNKQKPDA